MLQNGLDYHIIIGMPHPLSRSNGSDSEEAILRSMLGEYSDVIGEDFDFIRLGEVGFAVRFAKQPVNPLGDWLLYDLDDTIIGYSEAKPVRLNHYETYLKKHGIELDAIYANTMLDTADDLSRWITQGRKMYHIDAHAELLAWETELVSQLEPADRPGWIDSFRKTADQYLRELPHNTDDDTPFYYQNDGLVFKADVPGSDRIDELLEDVFDAMIRPKRYQDLLATMYQFYTDTVNLPFHLNQGILTYGSPDFQLRKTLELLRELKNKGEELFVASILLAKVKKGVFLEELLSLDPFTNPKAPFSDVANDFFNDIPHAILLVDDDPVELESFVSNNGHYDDFRYDLDLMGVRYQRQQTKNFGVVGVYGEHGSRIGHHSVDNTSHDLRRAVYSVLATQVIPPPESAPARENRWQNSISKHEFYTDIVEKLQKAGSAGSKKITNDTDAVKRRESEYLAGKRQAS